MNIVKVQIIIEVKNVGAMKIMEAKLMCVLLIFLLTLS